MKVAIVSLVYLEPDWQQTRRCLELCKSPVHYVDRIPAGVGNMAEAINRGFREVWESRRRPEYVWFVSNVTFDVDLLWKLFNAAIDTGHGYAAIHPCFASDHRFCQPGYFTTEIAEKSKNSKNSARSAPSVVKPIPFCEFTAPIVRADVFAQFPLDETMPYWGHDLDWGYRIWQGGHRIGVLQSPRELIGHAYIRNSDNGHPVTRQRHALRRATNASTKHRLRQKYGANYHDLIFPQSQQEIESWRQRILTSNIKHQTSNLAVS